MTTIASLEHANVVRATDAGHQDGLHYLVMEHLDGLDVGHVVNRMGTLDVADACEIVRQAALGLAHIHAIGFGSSGYQTVEHDADPQRQHQTVGPRIGPLG